MMQHKARNRGNAEAARKPRTADTSELISTICAVILGYAQQFQAQ
jgi:hypothetical protein